MARTSRTIKNTQAITHARVEWKREYTEKLKSKPASRKNASETIDNPVYSELNHDDLEIVRQI